MHSLIIVGLERTSDNTSGYSRWVDARTLATFCLLQIRYYDGQVHLRLFCGPPGPPKKEKVLGSSGVHYSLNLRSDVLAGGPTAATLGVALSTSVRFRRRISDWRHRSSAHTTDEAAGDLSGRLIWRSAYGLVVSRPCNT